MCRLFGLHAGAPVDAEFWLIDAPDSLSAQSHRNPDGAGVGAFTASGRPEVSKQPIAAWQDTAFARTARHLHGTTFVAHVRYASTGAHTVANTHPFLQDGRLFAHNGVVQGLPELGQRLTELGTAGLVRGETDSERVFALITGETRRHGGDLGRGITAAVGWIAASCPSTRSTWSWPPPRTCGRCATPRRTSCTCSAGRPGHRRRQPAGRPERPDPRAVAAPRGAALGHHRQRTDGRRPGLAAARAGGTAARPAGPQHGPQHPVPAGSPPPPAHSRPGPGRRGVPAPGLSLPGPPVRAAVPARWR